MYQKLFRVSRETVNFLIQIQRERKEMYSLFGGGRIESGAMKTAKNGW